MRNNLETEQEYNIQAENDNLKENVKWYSKTWVVLLFLVFMPIVGFFLMFFKTMWDMKIKNAITLIYIGIQVTIAII